MNGHMNAMQKEMASHLAFQMSLLRLSVKTDPDTTRRAPAQPDPVAAEKLAELATYLPSATRQ